MIWNFCIKRPVLTWVVFIIIGLFGFYGWMNLPVREFPDFDMPLASVSVVMRGADPEVVESEIIEPLEEEINTVEGLKELKSTSREQVGTITAEFELWRDIDVAVQDIRDSIERVRNDLPDDADPPIVRKVDPDAQAVLWITMLGDENWDLVRLTDYIDNVLSPQIEGMRGVGRVQIGGEKEYAVRVKLDSKRLNAHNLTSAEVVAVLKENNIKLPMGRVEGEQREFLIISKGLYNDAEGLRKLIVAERDGQPVRLGDLGEVVDGVKSERLFARYKGEPTIGMGIVRQADANTVQVVERVRARMEELKENFPPGIEYVIASDGSRFIAESILDLQTTIFISTFIVILVVLFFLQTLWGTLVITIAIPASLAAGFGIIYSLGFSMNILSLLAFILVVGIVVDDAIVILESTYRHMEEGANAMPAARVGTTEVAFAAIANTLSLCAVFVPVAFTRGIIGRIFFEFGITAAVTVFASTVTALTLAPMLNSRLLVVSEKKNWLSSAINSGLKKLEKIYGKVLDRSLNHRFIVIIIALIALLLGVFFFLQLSTEFAPDVDSSEFLISFETPQGSTLSETDNYVRRLEKILKETPEVDRYFLAVGLTRGAGPGEVNSGMSFVRLVDPDQRSDHQLQVMQKIREKLSRVPGGRSYVLVTGGPGGGEAPIQVVLKYSDLSQLSKYSGELMRWMREQDEFTGVNTDLEMENPQININFKRDKMARSGVSVREISQAINFMMGTPEISEVEQRNERYKIITEVTPKPLAPGALEEIYIRADDGELISLANFVDFEEAVGPSEIGHFNRRRSAIVSASTPPDVVLGDALNILSERIEETKPTGFEWTTAGQAQDMQESFQNLTVSLIFGIVFVYLVMAAQFESWLHPLTILMSLPLAGLGAFGLLYAFNMTFSIFPFIGIIMLVGLVTKNGILLVDYTNVLIARGSEVRDAVARAGRVRFRPVLMTAISTILGMMPIALGYGLGGEARAPMGWVVVGGMFTSSALTLLVIPVVYTLFDDLGEKLKTRWRYWCLYVFAFVSLLLATGLFWQSVAFFQGGLVGGIVATVAVVLLILAFGLFTVSSTARGLITILVYPVLAISILLAGCAYFYPHFLPGPVDWLVTSAIIIVYSLLAIFVTAIWPEES